MGCSLDLTVFFSFKYKTHTIGIEIQGIKFYFRYAEQIMVGDVVLVPSNYEVTCANVISVSNFIGQGAFNFI